MSHIFLNFTYAKSIFVSNPIACNLETYFDVQQIWERLSKAIYLTFV